MVACPKPTPRRGIYDEELHLHYRADFGTAVEDNHLQILDQSLTIHSLGSGPRYGAVQTHNPADDDHYIFLVLVGVRLTPT
jgi:hypothetical protein